MAVEAAQGGGPIKRLNGTAQKGDSVGAAQVERLKVASGADHVGGSRVLLNDAAQ